MKPENWDTMPTDEKLHEAGLLINSTRGRLIMGQALAKAVLAMRGVEPDYKQEPSNTQDMEMIGEMLYEPFYSMYLNGVV